MLKAILLLLILLLLPACAVEPLPAPTQATQVGRQQAIGAAEGACAGGHAAQLEPPRLLEARLMARSQAEAVLQGNGSPSQPPPLLAGGDPTPVWLVALEGRWQLTPTPPSPTPPVWTTCRAVIDAATGSVLEVN